MQPQFLLNDALAAGALCLMAEKRGLHVTRHEAEQTWRVVRGDSAMEKLGAAWSWLFPGHIVEQVPAALARNAQLPAWVAQGDAVGILTRLRQDDQPAQIQWLGQAPAHVDEAQLLWVPVSPGLINQETMVPRKQRGPATQAILAALRAHLPLYRRVGYMSVLMNLLSIAISLFAMQVYDRVVPNFAFSTLWVLASGVLLALTLELLLKLLRLKLLEASALRLDEALSLYFFEKLMSLKVDRRPARVGTLVAQVKDYEQVKSFFTSTTLFMLAEVPFVILFIAIIGMIGGPVAWVLVVLVPIGALIGFSVYKPMAEVQREENDEAARRTGVLFEAVAGAEVIKSQAGETRFSDVWLRSTRAGGELGVRLRKLSSYANFAVMYAQQLAYIGMIIVGVYVIQAGHLTVGGLIACSILSGRAFSGIVNITQILLQWHHAHHSLQILDNVLSLPTDDSPGREAHTRVAPLDLEIRDVKYAYAGVNNPQLVVSGMRIRAGERVAVMGRNGSGKSTLLKLLAGLATPNVGLVRIAGIDMQEARPGWLREVIGYLPQEVRLFAGTLAENLTLGLSAPDEARIREAMEISGLSVSLGRHPLGLNLPIREGGAGLSGGQRQMVGITRLILQDPKIWLLDEPSASLDGEAEERLVKLIQSLPRDRTVIFTSHKIPWISLADRMIMVEDGVIKFDAPASEVRVQSAPLPSATPSAPAAIASTSP